MPSLPFLDGTPISATGVLVVVATGMVPFVRKLPWLYYVLPRPSHNWILFDACCVLHQARALERRYGSARFFLFCFWPYVIALIVGQLAVATLDPALSKSLLGSVAAVTRNDLALICLWSALVTRVLSSVPARGKNRHWLTDKWVGLLGLGRCVLVDGLFNVSATAPLGARVAFAAMGVTMGLLLSPKSALGRTFLLRGLDHNRLFDQAVGSISKLISGGPFVFAHASTEAPAPDDAELQAALAASLGAAAGRPAPTGRPAAAPAGRPAAAAAAPRPAVAQLPVDRASLDLLMGLGLGCTEADAAEALRACEGNVDAAAALLMDHR